MATRTSRDINAIASRYWRPCRALPPADLYDYLAERCRRSAKAGAPWTVRDFNAVLRAVAERCSAARLTMPAQSR